ncbi:hypothetical protein V6N13_013844 [Hibiscus sabdariffa]|uniref:Uncharacterized protein n=1 Tax=Hibiscus sabdariffa TaxID=183260 RepID=A0ABR2RTZ9_9ROSI
MDDSLSSILQTRKSSPKKAKSKKPIKIVNSPAELPDDLTKFTDTEEAVDDVGGDNDDDNNQRVPDTATKNGTVTDYHVKEIIDLDRQLNSIIVDDVERDIPFDVFDDDVFTPQMIENFTGILPQGLFM